MLEKGELRFIGTVEVAGEISRVKIFPRFCLGLRGLEGFSHVVILY